MFQNINKLYNISYSLFSSINNMFTNILFPRNNVLRCILFLFTLLPRSFYWFLFPLPLDRFLFDDVGFDINFINLCIFVVVFDSVHLLYHLLFVPFSLIWLELSISVDVSFGSQLFHRWVRKQNWKKEWKFHAHCNFYVIIVSECFIIINLHLS